MKRLYKSNNNKVFFGVIGGIGEYFNIDPVILRIIWVVIVIFTAFIPGTIAYMIAIFVIPHRTNP
ncbi:PspC domain-containing protein [Patescibacteria group bacterium]|nr:PspC domain-containing protein [Patescibacteria group bacterium]